MSPSQYTLSSRRVAELLGISSMQMPSDFFFSEVVTDSRKGGPTSLFVALQGESQDGHAFIHEALSRGVRGVVYQPDRVSAEVFSSDVHFFPVQDSLLAYRGLAQAWRKQFSGPVVVIAGSVGKTTTKELLAALCRGRDEKAVLATEGSQNGWQGIPHTLLQLRSHHQVAVIEVGIDEIGAMEKHIQLVQPTHTLLTSIAPEHLEGLKNLETVEREELCSLSETIRQGGMPLLNLEDPRIAAYARTLPAKIPRRKFSFSLEETSHSLCGESLSGMEWRVRGLDLKEPMLLVPPLAGKHNALNLLGAVTVALTLGYTSEELVRGLKTFRALEGRSQLEDLSGGPLVICDYYNAQPASMKSGLALLEEQQKRFPVATSWACLGDMLELGENEEAFHRELALSLYQHSVSRVFLYGSRMKFLAQELAQMSPASSMKMSVKHFESREALAKELIQDLRSLSTSDAFVSRGRDVILMKGSHSMRMEEVWKLLQKEFCSVF